MNRRDFLKFSAAGGAPLADAGLLGPVTLTYGR